MATDPIPIGARRELFVDDNLIDTLDGVSLELHAPHPAGVAVTYEEPWESWICFYTTVLQDGAVYRMYYRGRGGNDLASLSGQPIRLKFVLQDADLYSLRFRE